ncbi:ISAs1 family transposase [Dactylosporangium sp. NPDC050688]|uniref:ISAs1 family transposase n=1 Tax=Dactylosporangium sp. NPDC050688 TaxID=3157217 RepID=UPI0033C32849
MGLHTPPAGQPPRRRAYAADGKTLRGSGLAGSQIHFLAAVDHHTGVVVAQTTVDSKTNEITRFVPLLAGLDLTGAVITADALHTQREHARWLAEQRNAGYVFVVKRNQPTLYHQVKHLPWSKVPIGDEVHTRGHGRYDIRRLQVLTVTPAIGLDFPHAVQAIRVPRRRMNLTTGHWSTVTVYTVTNLTADQATPAELADWLRGHWTVEVLHAKSSTPSAVTVPGCGSGAARSRLSRVSRPTGIPSFRASRVPGRPAGRSDRDRGQRRPQRRAVPGVRAGQARDLFDERDPGTPGLATDKSPRE